MPNKARPPASLVSPSIQHGKQCMVFCGDRCNCENRKSPFDRFSRLEALAKAVTRTRKEYAENCDPLRSEALLQNCTTAEELYVEAGGVIP